MSTYNWLARHLLAPSLDLMRGTHTMRSLTELEDSQWWSPERIEAIQAERLYTLIEHAYSHVPYYRRVMRERGLTPRDITSAADLPKLPLLTKAIIRDNLEDMCSKGPARTGMVVGRTSGSTGNPLLFYASRDEQRNRGLARAIRARGWAGVKLGDRSLHVHVAPEQSRRSANPGAWLKRELERNVDVEAVDVSELTLPALIARMKRIEPFYLGAYPTVVHFIASFIKDSGLSTPHPFSIITGGEQLLDHQRELIADVFGTEPYSKYSSFENWEMASECPSHSGMHVNAEDIILEIVDESGMPTPRGEQGKVLITNLFNYGMPLIRYENGDCSTLATTPCPCGRGLPLLDNALGRTTDFIYTRSGRRVVALGIPFNSLASLGVTQYQVVQNEPGHILLRLTAPAATTASARIAVENGARKLMLPSMGTDIDIEVEFTQHIEHTSAGKYLAIVSNVDHSQLPQDTVHADRTHSGGHSHPPSTHSGEERARE